MEGNYEYFESFVELSRVLEWEDKETKASLRLKNDQDHFVFGGDSQDKGTGDIRFVKLMVALKDKYPDRVHLMIGNRDANKLRLASELSPESLSSEAVKTDPDFPYWVAKDKVVTPAKYLAASSLEDTAANRLRWILK